MHEAGENGAPATMSLGEDFEGWVMCSDKVINGSGQTLTVLEKVAKTNLRYMRSFNVQSGSRSGSIE